MRCNQVANCGFSGLLDRKAECATSSSFIKKKQFRKCTVLQDFIVKWYILSYVRKKIFCQELLLDREK